MRVMLDTNVLISALILRSSTIKRVTDDIALNQELLLSTFVIDELKAVVALKWPDRLNAIDDFLRRASFETIITPDDIPHGLFEIRDKEDYPVLYSAIIGAADILVTGDKDFAEVEIDKPLIVTPSEYVDSFLGSI